jgi:hypothetical protein
MRKGFDGARCKIKGNERVKTTAQRTISPVGSDVDCFAVWDPALGFLDRGI